jgi:hypothetical protein
MAQSNQSVKTYDDLFLKIDHYAKYPAMLPYVGGNYISAIHMKLMLIGESNYFPETSTIHKDAIKWYDGNQSLLSAEEIEWLNNRELTACARHQNYKNINDCLAELKIAGSEKPISHISYMNAFQRPAVDTGKSFKYCCTEKDILISVATIDKVIEIIEPDIIIFVSKYSWDALHGKIAIKDELYMDFVSHPTDPFHWQNKKYLHGKMKFMKLLAGKYLQGTS